MKLDTITLTHRLDHFDSAKPRSRLSDLSAILHRSRSVDRVGMDWSIKRMRHHPYYPEGVSIRNYVPNSKSTAELLSIIGISFSVVVGSSWYILGRYMRHLSRPERCAATWFIFCGLLHVIFEG